MSWVALARGAWRQRKAWGGAERNPRLATFMKFERAKRAIAQTPQVPDDESAIAHSAGSALILQRSWGCASLHPRLYAITRSAGYGQNSFDLIRAASSRSLLTDRIFLAQDNGV